MDYVCAWYLKAALYVSGTRIIVGFVSTNSLSQGEQVAILWTHLFREYGIKILFAYRTFSWESEARGKAHVHVIIVGFANFDAHPKLLFDYGADADIVTNISPYLVEGPDVCVTNRSEPISDVPPMRWGSQPRDGGHLILSREERDELIGNEPGARKWIKPYVGAEEMLQNSQRWCLWLQKITPNELSALPLVRLRVERVKKTRLNSKAASTRSRASTPMLFAQIAQPDTSFLLVPLVSSERRPYVPAAFYPKTTIASNACCLIPGADLFLFGVFSSGMHMAWMRQVAGRLKSDYRYSKDIVYNNYPWPTNSGPARIAKVEELAQAVLEARRLYGDSALAQLYDPVLMPPELVKAHQRLDRAVEKCYRPEPFASDRERVEFLFALYEQLTTPLLPAVPVRRRARHERAQ